MECINPMSIQIVTRSETGLIDVYTTKDADEAKAQLIKWFDELEISVGNGERSSVEIKVTII